MGATVATHFTSIKLTGSTVRTSRGYQIDTRRMMRRWWECAERAWVSRKRVGQRGIGRRGCDGRSRRTSATAADRRNGPIDRVRPSSVGVVFYKPEERPSVTSMRRVKLCHHGRSLLFTSVGTAARAIRNLNMEVIRHMYVKERDRGGGAYG